MATRSKWKGFVEPESLDPSLLEKFRAYRRRFYHYCRILPIPAFGTGNSAQAHVFAERDVPLTAEEKDIMRRLANGSIYEEIDAEHEDLVSRQVAEQKKRNGGKLF